MVWSRGREVIYKAVGSSASSTKHLARPCCNHHCSSTSNFRGLTCASRFLTCNAHAWLRVSCKLASCCPRTLRRWRTRQGAAKFYRVHQTNTMTLPIATLAERRSYRGWVGVERQPCCGLASSHAFGFVLTDGIYVLCRHLSTPPFQPQRRGGGRGRTSRAMGGKGWRGRREGGREGGSRQGMKQGGD